MKVELETEQTEEPIMKYNSCLHSVGRSTLSTSQSDTAFTTETLTEIPMPSRDFLVDRVKIKMVLHCDLWAWLHFAILAEIMTSSIARMGDILGSKDALKEVCSLF